MINKGDKMDDKEYDYEVIVKKGNRVSALKLSQIQVDKDDGEVYAIMLQTLLKSVQTMGSKRRPSHS